MKRSLSIATILLTIGALSARGQDLGADLDRAEALLAEESLSEESRSEARAILLQVLSSNALTTDAALLGRLGGLCLEAGLHFEAESAYSREVALLEQDAPPLEAMDSKTGYALSGKHYTLGVILRDQGNIERARKHMERSREIMNAIYDTVHIHMAWVWSSLGAIYDDLGLPNRSKAILDETLVLIDAAYDGENEQILPYLPPLRASCLNNLGLVLKDLGDYKGSERAFREAIDTFDEENQEISDLSTYLGNLAEICLLQGRPEESISIQERALELALEQPGGDTPWEAVRREELAEAFAARGDFEQARRELEMALRIHEDRGLSETDRVRALDRLGLLLIRQGEIQSAVSHLSLASSLADSALPPDHPLASQTLADLALAWAWSGQTDRSIEAALRAEGLSRHRTEIVVSTLPERLALSHTISRASGLDLAMDLLISEGREDFVKRVWDEVLRSRALVLNEMGSRAREGFEPGENDSLLVAYREASARYSHLIMGELERDAVDRVLLRQASNERERLELALAERSASFRLENKWRLRGISDVEAALPKRTALVAYLEYDAVRSKDGEPRMASFVLWDTVAKAVDLGPLKDISGAVQEWVSLAGAPGTSELTVRSRGERVRQLVWDPVRSLLGDASMVLVVPDGPVNAVGFYALPEGDKAYLVETGPAIHYLSTERDILLDEGPRIAGEGWLIVGGADFDAEPQSHEDLAIGVEVETEEIPDVVRGDCTDLRDRRFAYLEGTEAEAVAIEELAKTISGRAESVARLGGSTASEEAVKEASPGRRVLHFATHGFFLGGDCVESEKGNRGLSLVAVPGRSRALFRENPLVLSGLALSGANLRSSRLQGDDGLLTAFEVATLDLRSADWAVLSACETGVGELRSGEGVMGLRRAFHIAGVRTLVMSLWPVSDRWTRIWMDSLYHARFEKKTSTVEAVRIASLSALEQSRAEGLAGHPFHWAGFVAAGDWN